MNTTKAPQSQWYRTVSSADTIPATDKKHGLNCENYETVHFEILPSGGANPACELLFWSESAARFISGSTPVTISAAGANTPHTFSYDCKGRIVMLAVTTLAAGSVQIYTNAYGLDSQL